MTNISLLHDISKIEKRTNEVVNNIDYAHLIATLYVLEEDPTNSFTKNKEENNMKIGNKISNRTKIMGGTSILLALATVVSVVKDNLDLKSSEENVIEEAADVIIDVIEEAIDDIPEGVDTIIS